MVIRSPSTGSASVAKLHSRPSASPSGALFIFVLRSVSWFNELKLSNTISMATIMVSFDLDVYNLSEKFLLLTFNSGNKVLIFE